MSTRVLMIQNSPKDPPGRLSEWFAEAGVEITLLQPFAGDAIPEQVDADGLVVLGGQIGANDTDVAWLPAEKALLRAVISDETPTLGICLGAQLLGVANGARVEVMPDGPEVGAQLIAKRAAASTDPLFGPMPITPDVMQWHHDAITSLPPAALHLASSPACEIQAFRLGRLAWGIQFHIETTQDIVQAWAELDAAALEDYDIDAILSRADAAHADIAEVWQPFIAAFADVARDPAAVAAARSVRTSTAAPVTDPEAIRAALAAELNASRTAPLPMPAPRSSPDG